jgi:hypothetical protein
MKTPLVIIDNPAVRIGVLWYLLNISTEFGAQCDVIAVMDAIEKHDFLAEHQRNEHIKILVNNVVIFEQTSS